MDRFKTNYLLMKDWLSLRLKGGTLKPWFQDNLIQSVAVYGLGQIGELLEEELTQNGIEIGYAIDQASQDKKREFPVYSIDLNGYPDMDVLIVSTVSVYWDIVDLLRDRISSPIVSLEDVVSYCLSMEVV